MAGNNQIPVNQKLVYSHKYYGAVESLSLSLSLHVYVCVLFMHISCISRKCMCTSIGLFICLSMYLIRIQQSRRDRMATRLH